MTKDGETLRRARAAGILTKWQDYRGQSRQVSLETLRALLNVVGDTAEAARRPMPSLVTAVAGQAFSLPSEARGVTPRLTLEGRQRGFQLEVKSGSRGLIANAPREAGYYRLSIGKREITLAVAPAQSSEPREAGPRAWGISAQLYSLYRPGDGGLAGYTALRDLVKSSVRSGASVIAVSPLHAQFSADLSRFSPYAPSSRLWLNVLHIDPDAAAATLGFGTRRNRNPHADKTPLVDWPEASLQRLAALQALYRRVRDAGRLRDSGPLARDFRAFRRGGGAPLMAHAVFEALHAHFYGLSSGLWHWRSWPAGFREPDDAAIRRLAHKHEESVGFHLFLQWLAARQFREASEAGTQAGMRIGIVKDIAVGADSGGSEAWSNPGRMLTGASIGAPPDAFNTLGQKWGVTTFSPAGLAAGGFQAFIDLLRRSLSDAGGIRIDHILGLQRLWIVPDDADPEQGAYIRYPLTDLLRLVALEANRSGAMVLGEDLGTVPAGFRGHLSEFGIRGMQLLWFERDGREFRPSKRWRRSAVAMTTTHDLPTVAGWWMGKDVAWRRRLKLFPSERFAAKEAANRERDRQLLWRAFLQEGVATGPVPTANRPAKVIAAAIAYLGKTSCEVALLPLEDALGRKEQPNLPGTTNQHPNWRRRILIPSGEICRQGKVAQRLRLLALTRTTP